MLLEVNAIVAVCAAGAAAVAIAGASAFLSRVHGLPLPGFSKSNAAAVDATQGVRRSALQVSSYALFILALAAASYVAGLRSTADWELFPGGGENIYPLALVPIVLCSWFALARTVVVHQSGLFDVLLAALGNGFALFLTAQAGTNLQAWGVVVAMFVLTTVAAALIAWQTSTCALKPLHYAAMFMPILLSAAAWLWIVLTFTFEIFSVHHWFYFFFPWIVGALLLVQALVNFAASVKSCEGGAFEEVNAPRRRKHN